MFFIVKYFGLLAVQNTLLLTEIFCYHKVAVLIIELLLQLACVQMSLLHDGHK